MVLTFLAQGLSHHSWCHRVVRACGPAGPGSGSCFSCSSVALGRWLPLSVFLGGTTLTAGSLHPFPPAPCAVRSQLALLPWPGRGVGRWAGKVGFSPVFSSSSPRTPAFRWGGAAPDSPEGAGRWLTPPWPLVLEEGRSSGLAGSSVTLPVTPCEAWWVDGWEQQPLLAVHLSAPRHPRKCCHLSRHP